MGLFKKIVAQSTNSSATSSITYMYIVQNPEILPVLHSRSLCVRTFVILKLDHPAASVRTQKKRKQASSLKMCTTRF